MSPLTYTFDDLRAVLKLGSARTAARRLKAWEARGFPRRLPDGRALWSKPAVDAWLAGDAAGQNAPPPQFTPTVPDAFGVQ